MREGRVQLLFRVLLAFCFCAFQGCEKRALEGPKAGGSRLAESSAKPAGDNPTAEEARTALIELVKTCNFEGLGFTKEGLEMLKSKKTLHELEKATIYVRYHRNGDQTMIGSWSCYLSENKFFKSVVETRASSLSLAGRFELGPDGHWKAVDGSQIADHPYKGP